MNNYKVQAILELKDRFSSNIKKLKDSTVKSNKAILTLRTNLNRLKEISGVKKVITQFKKMTQVIEDLEKRAIKRLKNSLKDLGNSLKNKLKSFSVGALKGMAVTGIASIGYAIKQGMDYQKYKTMLVTANKGDVNKAKEQMNWARQFANVTPYGTKEVIESTVKLQMRGLDPKKTLKQLGDLASALGKPIDQATEAFLDLATGEFERFKEFGINKDELINFSKELAKTDKRFANVFDKSGKSVLKHDRLLDTALRLMDKKFKDSMKKQSETLLGQISTFKGKLDDSLAVGSGFGSKTGGLIGDLTKWLTKINNSFDPQKIGDSINAFYEDIKKNFIGFVDGIKSLKDNFLKVKNEKGVFSAIVSTLKEAISKIWNSDVFKPIRTFFEPLKPLLDVIALTFKGLAIVVKGIARLLYKLTPKGKFKDTEEALKYGTPIEKLKYLKSLDPAMEKKYEELEKDVDNKEDRNKYGLFLDNRVAKKYEKEIENDLKKFNYAGAEYVDLSSSEDINSALQKYHEKREEIETEKVISQDTVNNNVETSKYEENNVNNIKNEDKSSENNIINQPKYEENKINQINKEETNNKNIITNKNEKNINNTQIKEEHFKNENSNPQIIANKNPETNNMSFNINLDFSNTQFGVGVTKEYVNESLNRYLKNWQLELTTFVEGTI